MKILFLSAILALAAATPAPAAFENECLQPFLEEAGKADGVSKVKLKSTKVVKDVSRDKLCGMRYIHEVNYTFEYDGYPYNGYGLILYSCNGCETLGDWQQFEDEKSK